MMQVVCLVWGILAISAMFVFFIPCLGAFNWLNIPFAAVGLVISAVVYGNSQPGRRGAAMAGLILNLLAIVLGAFRLMVGGGIL